MALFGKDKKKKEEETTEETTEEATEEETPVEEAPKASTSGAPVCADCGKEVTDLPFTPSGDRPVYCSDCFSKRKTDRRSSGGERRMVTGNWKCAGCGTEITELPFEPEEGREVFCRDCWQKNRP